jgi:hypothetical protein
VAPAERWSGAEVELMHCAFDECAQDRQRQIGVMGLDRLIQPVRQFPLA